MSKSVSNPSVDNLSELLKTGQDTGGVSGSVCVTLNDGSKAQYKPSTLDYKGAVKNAKALVKGGLTHRVDYENLTELITSHVATAVTKDQESSIVTPEVMLIGTRDENDKKSAGIRILSKYLDNFSPFGNKEKFGDKDTRYVKIKFNEVGDNYFQKITKSGIIKSPKKKEIIQGYMPIGGDENKKLRQGICDAIALNILIANADVNARGNLGLVDGGNKVGCIDFGHGLNSLIAGPSAIGGGVKDANSVLDFINRSKVLGGPGGDASKLWRDYDGMIPSEEFGNALAKIASQQDKISEGVSNAKKTLRKFADQLKTPKDREMLALSLKRINKNIGIEMSSQSQDIGPLIDATLDNVGKFCEKRCEEMLVVSRLVRLQSDIDKMIIGVEGISDKLRAEYEDVTMHLGGEVRWAKTNARDEPVVGDLNHYIVERKKQINTEHCFNLQTEIDKKLSSGIGQDQIVKEFAKSYEQLGKSHLRASTGGIIWEKASGNGQIIGDLKHYVTEREKQISKNPEMRLTLCPETPEPQSQISKIASAEGVKKSPIVAKAEKFQSNAPTNSLSPKSFRSLVISQRENAKESQQLPSK